MKDRSYSELTWFPISGPNQENRHQREGQRAVTLAYSTEIEQITKHLRNRQSVLVLSNKSLAPFVEECLRENLTATWVPITCQARATRTEADQRVQHRSPVQVLLQELEIRLSAAIVAKPPPILILRHLDLMAWTASDSPSLYLNEILYWLTEFTEVVKLVFWDPVYSLPKVIEDLFPNRVSLQIFNREVLWKLVSELEAKKISPSAKEFTIPAQLTLYQYVSGSTVPEVRRVLRNMLGQNYPDCSAGGICQAAFKYIRQEISSGTAQPIFDWTEPAGYDALRSEFKRKIIFPFEKRFQADSAVVLEQFDAIIPRGVILYGPPGTGKTEWAKWLAGQLNLTLLVVHGPELKHSLVGETEAAIRRIFARARREAPSLILIDELDALTPSRTTNQSNYEASMVAQLLTEMDGLHKDEAVLVLGTTNRLNAVDYAFRRPGRFGESIEVDYPQADDRQAILRRYNEKLNLGLNGQSINWLARETEGSMDPKTRSPRFSGDHVRAICLYLLRESLYRRYQAVSMTHDVNDPAFLKEALEAVRKRQVLSGSTGPSDADDVWGTSEF